MCLPERAGVGRGVLAPGAAATLTRPFMGPGCEQAYFFEPFRADWKKGWVSSADPGFDGEWEYKGNYSDIAEDFGETRARAPARPHRDPDARVFARALCPPHM